MEQVTAWLSAHWATIVVVMVLVTRLLNVTTKHWSEHKGLVKVCLYIVDMLDVFKATPPPGGGK